MAAIEDLRMLALAQKGVTEDVKWENHLCFNVGEKMFLITSPDEFPVSACIKVSEDNFVKLCEQKGIIPAPYLARYNWVAVDDINKISLKVWKVLIEESYELIYSKLPTKIKKLIQE